MQADVEDLTPENENEHDQLIQPQVTLNVSPERASEARGVAWCDIYRQVTLENGKRVTLKISLTSRSDEGPIPALDGLFKALTWAQERKWYPYMG